MIETQAAYLPDNSLTIDQLKMIDGFLDIIRQHGGFGIINIEVKSGRVKFINLEKLSVKATGGDQEK